jgi:preprotein translocase subunit YajC
LRLIEILAQTTNTAAGPTTSGQPVPAPLEFIRGILPILLLVIVFFFLMTSSKRKQEKQHKDMLSNLKKGDRVQTIGGIIGTVVEARENEILVKVDESSNTKIKFSRSAIHRVLEEDKAENK